jgi:hypothetical protein
VNNKSNFFNTKMGWRYVLVNHTMQVIEDTSLHNVWQLMAFLIKECGWSSTDNVVMLSEETSWNEIGKCVKSGYKSHYQAWSFN